MENKKRLIDVDEVLKKLRKVEPSLKVVSIVGVKAVSIDAVIQYLERQKTVDAVEVVRCKDCKRFASCEEVDGVSWTGFCEYGQFHTDEDDFCSRGERKDND
jgi:hypothetical protein